MNCSQEEFFAKCIVCFENDFKYKDNLGYYIKEFGQDILIKKLFCIHSEKHNLDYEIDFYQEQIYIVAQIYQPCYPTFRLMNDKFWEKMLEINKFAKLEFVQNTPFDKRIKSRHNKSKSNSAIFELIKTFVLLDEYQAHSIDVGCLQAVFDINKNEETLIDEVAKTLRIFYHLNNELQKKCTQAFIDRYDT